MTKRPPLDPTTVKYLVKEVFEEIFAGNVARVREKDRRKPVSFAAYGEWLRGASCERELKLPPNHLSKCRRENQLLREHWRKNPDTRVVYYNVPLLREWFRLSARERRERLKGHNPTYRVSDRTMVVSTEDNHKLRQMVCGILEEIFTNNYGDFVSRILTTGESCDPFDPNIWRNASDCDRVIGLKQGTITRLKHDNMLPSETYKKKTKTESKRDGRDTIVYHLPLLKEWFRLSAVSQKELMCDFYRRRKSDPGSLHFLDKEPPENENSTVNSVHTPSDKTLNQESGFNNPKTRTGFQRKRHNPIFDFF